MSRSTSGQGRLMATYTGLLCCPLFISHSRIQLRSKTLHFLFVLGMLLAIVPAAQAQTPLQQYVYSSGAVNPRPSVVSGFTKASQTGALGLVPGSPSTNGWRAVS